MRLFSSVKVIGAVAINLSLIKCTYDHNRFFQKSFRQLSDKEQFEMKVRDFALRDNPYYLSETPYLRAMAIANYNNNPHDRLRAKHQYLAQESARNQHHSKLSK